MRLPRDVAASDLIKASEKFGYRVTHQTGSHIRLTTSVHGEHHITIPNHAPIRLGTLNAIIGEIARHLSLDKSEVLHRLFSD